MVCRSDYDFSKCPIIYFHGDIDTIYIGISSSSLGNGSICDASVKSLIKECGEGQLTRLRVLACASWEWDYACWIGLQDQRLWRVLLRTLSLDRFLFNWGDFNHNVHGMNEQGRPCGEIKLQTISEEDASLIGSISIQKMFAQLADKTRGGRHGLAVKMVDRGGVTMRHGREWEKSG